MENKRKVLILGGDGMAGHMVRTYLTEAGHDVSVTTRTGGEDGNRRYDIADDYVVLEAIIAEIRPEFVVNCIGVLTKSAEDNKPVAVLVNSFLPHYVDSLSVTYGFRLIHISTDCVFSGKRGGYTEKDVPDETSFYGRTKALGEINNDRSLTFRTSIVGPDLNENGVGLFNWFMKQEGEVRGYSKVVWTGVTTLQLAKSIERSFETDATGLHHLVNNQKITKLGLLKLFKEAMRKNIEIREDSSVVSDKSLVSTRKDVSFDISDYETMVREMGEWIFARKERYTAIISNAKK